MHELASEVQETKKQITEVAESLDKELTCLI
jgi:hypothetical protein